MKSTSIGEAQKLEILPQQHAFSFLNTRLIIKAYIVISKNRPQN
ncbi:hypothetical protein TcasGA2_TC034759 [Tribolium castaneum]|uniref:Uncharacterized protein n=1 Tax=Tribolium castaneum TaxID=7070 RepID=A0A139WG36_TRICA|nr:hypothetical protein TcasGA2_TC034759 [Tribolium castaneum]